MNKFEYTKTSKQDIPLPRRATSGSAGYDFFLPEDIDIRPCKTVKVATGIKCQITEGWLLQIYPRSSIGFKYNIRLANTVGIIDSDYYNNPDNEGEIFIKLYNPGFDRIKMSKGDAFAQGIFTQYGLTVDDEATAERTGGIGSTNV